MLCRNIGDAWVEKQPLQDIMDCFGGAAHCFGVELERRIISQNGSV
jgi:hypothetical protein